MVYHPVDGRCGSHRVLEDLIPLGEHEVACDHHALTLVALGEQGEEHLHLRAVLLHIANIIERQALDAIQALQLPPQAQVALGLKEPLDQRGDGGEEHCMALADSLVPDRRHHRGLARARLAKETKIGRSVQEVPLDEGRELSANRGGEAREV